MSLGAAAEGRCASAQERVARLTSGKAEYDRTVSPHYDEVLHEIQARAAVSGSLGKLDIGGLLAWKRLRADVTWVREFMSTSENQVRDVTGCAMQAGRDLGLSVPVAARVARSALTALPGFSQGDAMASAVCLALAPDRFAVYDQRANDALGPLGLDLTRAPRRYERYMELVEQLRYELREAHENWTAREVDQALFQLGSRHTDVDL